MPEAASRHARPADEPARDALALVQPLPNVALLHLLRPKWLTARVRARGGERGRTRADRAARRRPARCSGRSCSSSLFRLLTYFRGVPDIGPLLAGKLLGLILLSFFAILLLSNVITALSSFFLARDLDLLVVGARGLAPALRRQAARDGGALELDGRADGGADLRRVRRRCTTAGCCFRWSRSPRFFPSCSSRR